MSKRRNELRKPVTEVKERLLELRREGQGNTPWREDGESMGMLTERASWSSV